MNEKVYIFLCAGSTAVIWIAISFGYKALLQLGAIFMAFTTRKVKVKGLNDTKEIYTIIYINTVIITMLIVTEFALRTHRDAYISLYGVAIFSQATLFLSLTFIPKVQYANYYIFNNNSRFNCMVPASLCRLSFCTMTLVERTCLLSMIPSQQQTTSQ